jgi:hypothetical protein
MKFLIAEDMYNADVTSAAVHMVERKYCVIYRISEWIKLCLIQGV